MEIKVKNNRIDTQAPIGNVNAGRKLPGKKPLWEQKQEGEPPPPENQRRNGEDHVPKSAWASAYAFLEDVVAFGLDALAPTSLDEFREERGDKHRESPFTF